MQQPSAAVLEEDSQCIRGRVHATRQISAGETCCAVVTTGFILKRLSAVRYQRRLSVCVSFSCSDLRRMEQAGGTTVSMRGAARNASGRDCSSVDGASQQRCLPRRERKRAYTCNFPRAFVGYLQSLTRRQRHSAAQGPTICVTHYIIDLGDFPFCTGASILPMPTAEQFRPDAFCAAPRMLTIVPPACFIHRNSPHAT